MNVAYWSDNVGEWGQPAAAVTGAANTQGTASVNMTLTGTNVCNNVCPGIGMPWNQTKSGETSAVMTGYQPGIYFANVSWIASMNTTATSGGGVVIAHVGDLKGTSTQLGNDAVLRSLNPGNPAIVGSPPGGTPVLVGVNNSIVPTPVFSLKPTLSNSAGSPTSATTYGAMVTVTSLFQLVPMVNGTGGIMLVPVPVPTN